MKIKLNVATGQLVDDSIVLAIREELDQSGLPSEEQGLLFEHRCERMTETVAKWLRAVRVVLDTTTGEAAIERV